MRILFLILLATTFIVACDRTDPVAEQKPSNVTGPVTVEIRRPGGAQTFIVESVSDGTTVASFMKSLDQVPVEIRGSGATAFVESIDNVSTGADTGWTYKVDGEFVPRGVGVFELHPPTTLQWSYGEWEETADASD